jgi:acyl-CoA dehydrogenase
MPEQLPPDIQAVLTQAKSFLATEVVPREAQRRALDDDAALHRAVREASKAAGFFYKTQPAAFGGRPASALELTALRELWAEANTPLTRSIFGPGPGLLHEAQGELKFSYLDPVMAGEKKGAFGFTEPDDAVRPTWATLSNEALTINGQKSYVTGGSTADFLTILVNVEDSEKTKLGTAMVVVDRTAPGVMIDRTFSSMEGGGHAAFRFENVSVPVWHMIGSLGEGMPRALANIQNVRLMVAAEATGICLWTLAYLAEHLDQPHRTGTPLSTKEGVRLRYADLRIETYAARSLLYRVARWVDSGENAVNEVISAKVFCSELAGKVVDTAVQLVGGSALVVGHPLEAMYRKVRSMRLIEGANDLLRLNLAKGYFEMGKGGL